MSSIIRPLLVPRAEASTSLWARRRDIPIAILAWTTLAAVLLWGAGHIARTLLLLVVAALLAYALAPGVKLLERVMPRFLAILIMYIIVLRSGELTDLLCREYCHSTGRNALNLCTILAHSKKQWTTNSFRTVPSILWYLTKPNRLNS